MIFFPSRPGSARVIGRDTLVSCLHTLPALRRPMSGLGIKDIGRNAFINLDKKYKTLRFPFEEKSAPAFVMQADWDLSELAGFLVHK